MRVKGKNCSRYKSVVSENIVMDKINSLKENLVAYIIHIPVKCKKKLCKIFSKFLSYGNLATRGLYLLTLDYNHK